MKIIMAWALLAGCAAVALAKGLPAEVFASTPAPGQMELMSPRALAVNAAGTRVYVLDSGLRRLLTATLDGQFISAKALPDKAAPEATLAATRDAAYLLQVDRDAAKLALLPLDGPGKARVLALPEGAAEGAFTLDAAGRVLAVYLSLAGGKLELLLARENAEHELETVAAQRDPCEGQWKYLTITGFTTAADGRVAIGIAQAGDPSYSYVRSWLLEAKLQDGTPVRELRVAARDSLVDSRGKVKDRYKGVVEMAGRAGYPAKPCIPLFAAPALIPDGLVTGGSAADPFLRCYARDGQQYVLQSALPHPAPGAQSVAASIDKKGARIFALTAAGARVEELSPDGRVIGGFGRSIAYSLVDPAALAADAESVYVAARWNDSLHLVRFTADGRFRWVRDIAPPPGMAGAQVFLTVPASDRVLIGWRRPETAGLGWVDTMMEDGTPGLPLWDEPATETTQGLETCPTPLITGDNGSVYLLRETKGGLQVQAVSLTGATTQRLPSTVQGLTAVNKDGSLAWAHHDGDNLVISLFNSEGGEFRVKRVPRPAKDAVLRLASAGGWWGWLSNADTLLQFDETMSLIDESPVDTPDGKPVTGIAALAGSRGGRLYLALPDKILVLKNPGK
ncbi:MAG: hypothetical protein ACYC6A_04275 [Armatimonadota bacterium]